jgi:uncharacterized protein (TIGR01777 family)
VNILRILIAGGTGMIGIPLVDLLLKSGHELSILTREPGKGKFPHNIEQVQWDGSSLTGWSQHIGGMDAVINLAGENIGSQRWSPGRKNLIIESRVNIGKLLTEAIQNASIRLKVFIQASAVGYYGVNNNDVLTELTQSGDDFLAGVCKKWEDSSREVERLGIRRVIIRTGVVLSKELGALNRMLLPFKLFSGGPIGNGRQMLSWIHLADEVGAIRFLLENADARGVYNLTAPEAISNAQLGKVLAKTIHRPYWMPVPAFVLRCFVGEMSTLVLEGQNVFPKRLLEAGFQFKFERIDDALIDILN